MALSSAMWKAAGVTDGVWDVSDFVKLLDEKPDKPIYDDTALSWELNASGLVQGCELGDSPMGATAF